MPPQRSRSIVRKTEVRSRVAVVATMYPQASEAAAAILEQGGSAADAAVAAAFAIGVVEPFNSGLGGIGQFTYYEAATGRSWIVDGISSLPRRLDPIAFPLSDGAGTSGVYAWPAVKDDANVTGYRAAAVPGLPACLCLALERFGRLPRATVMQPAIALAEDGFTLDWYVALTLAAAQRRLWLFPESRRTFFRPDGSCYRPTMMAMAADHFRQPDLAWSLRQIAAEGPDAVYRGEIGRRIAAAMATAGGWVDEAELRAFRCRVWDGGLQGSYRGLQTIQPPQHSGGPTVVETLNILEGFDLASFGHNTAPTLHAIAESLRHAFLDRFRFLGDARLAPVPHAGLVSKEYAAARRAGISLDRAAPDAGPGDPWSFDSVRPTALPPARPTAEGQTTHITVVDADRNMASLTATLGDHFGSAVVIPGTGIVMNNATSWFDPVPGSVNSIAPGAQIVWASTPTLVLRDGKPFMALGAPGGRRIISAVVQTIVNVVDFGLGIQDAVAAPRLHCEGPVLEVDALVGDDTVAALRRLGHPVTVREETFASSYFARPNGVLVHPETGELSAGVNQYKPALAIGL